WSLSWLRSDLPCPDPIETWPLCQSMVHGWLTVGTNKHGGFSYFFLIGLGRNEGDVRDLSPLIPRKFRRQPGLTPLTGCGLNRLRPTTPGSDPRAEYMDRA